MTVNPFKAEGQREIFSPVDSQKAEGVPLSSQVALAKSNLAEEQEKKSLDKLASIISLDWKAVPPPVLAQVLTQIPYKGSAGDPDYFLKPWQAMIFAMRCFELGLSPFSGEVWFNAKQNRVNVTLEGKLKINRNAGYQIGVPVFERDPEDRTKPLVAYTCKVSVWVHNEKQILEYRADLKEWKKPGAMWTSNPEHMLRTRAYEKALSWIGTGASEMPDDKDIMPPEPISLSAITSTEFIPVNPEVTK